MRGSRGFTLIELIMCIIILGVVGVVALPKLLGIQKDARIAVLYGAREALMTANNLVYTKAVIQSQENINSADTRNIDLDNDGVNDLIGYFGLIKNVIPAKELAVLTHNSPSTNGTAPIQRLNPTSLSALPTNP